LIVRLIIQKGAQSSLLIDFQSIIVKD